MCEITWLTNTALWFHMFLYLVDEPHHNEDIREKLKEATVSIHTCKKC
jgi:hypothetical protein